jgi:hypothetical protein
LSKRLFNFWALNNPKGRIMFSIFPSLMLIKANLPDGDKELR